MPRLDGTGGKITVIGIDGPTAAGKTIFADAVAARLRGAHRRTCWTYRVDWTLEPRNRRVSDLEDLQGRGERFRFEAELHMRLDGLRAFLGSVRAFNEERPAGAERQGRRIALDGLYSRDHGGTLAGRAECVLEPGMVILVEGHYTLRTAFDNLIDYNILLLGEAEELLKRKTARVQGYRAASAAGDYFRLVDLPSFRHHLRRFGCNADTVIDNTDYRAPRQLPPAYRHEWLARNGAPSPAEPAAAPPEGLSGIVDRVLSPSGMAGAPLRDSLRASLEFILEWDRHVDRFLRVNVGSIPGDLTALTHRLLAEMNARLPGAPCRCEVRHTNALYNVYRRTLPLTIGLEISGGRSLKVLADVFHDRVRVQVSWAGGYSRFLIGRTPGDLSGSTGFTVADATPACTGGTGPGEPVRLIVPTLFTVPGFLREFEVTEVFSGREEENLSASQALLELAEQGGVWVHRFARFSELRYFADIIIDCGGNAVQAGNYLIAAWSGSERLHRSFKVFRAEWAAGVADAADRLADEDRLDAIIDRERRELERFVTEHCPDLTVLDGYLQCPDMTADVRVRERIIGQIGLLLASGSRLLRKRTVELILKHFPGLLLDAADLWDRLPAGAAPRISLEALTTLSPTILAEVYLWLALRDDRSAVLGINIYDLRPGSLDCRSYLAAAAARQTAVVLQGSLNALGQREEDNGWELYGYLRPVQGAQDLIDATVTAVRDLVLTTGAVPPLFGIGLDHVDAAGDRPRGRARRFLKDALDTGWVTHCVLDGSERQDGRSGPGEALSASFERNAAFTVGLLGGDPGTYLCDKEICVGELNYPGGGAAAYIPTPDDIELFVRILRRRVREAGLGANNTRPTLLAGNLGTIHHDRDRDLVEVERSRAWRDRVKRLNCVSAVLHGTTDTHPRVLAEATTGCHKINIAGESLTTLIRALPPRLQKAVRSPDREPKERMAEVRGEMDGLSAAEITGIEGSLQAYGRQVLDTINAPRLSPPDVEYFRYKNYRFTPQQISAICREIGRELDRQVPSAAAGPADPAAGLRFFASMVEVPFDASYERLTCVLWEEGVRCFHVDAGDGRFIPRAFSGEEKASYLRRTFPDAVIHSHLMAETPHQGRDGGRSLIERYAGAGCNAVAVHRRAFRDELFFREALEQVRACGMRPGIVIETSEVPGADLADLILRSGLDWAVVMGVPIGYGGQIFDMSALKRIAWLHQLARSRARTLLIEVDGGLTMNNLPLCRQAGAQAFSGWSVVKGGTEELLRRNVRTLLGLLGGPDGQGQP